nr:MAG: hypothetical protein DIU81_01960 [[Clostridium] cellulosi]
MQAPPPRQKFKRTYIRFMFCRIKLYENFGDKVQVHYAPAVAPAQERLTRPVHQRQNRYIHE